ncbi:MULTISPECIES: hypothetical protein [Metabacillus]|uniref:Uncharacterized protein n=1 Tax=Metabacillus elymi TaxID=2745198 RepID=A0ABX6SA55_9BACI|nr:MULTISPECIES: hypothetical protein [Metabacillus]QNF28676.1 hypothetical protein HUW50_15065 [Metabacillus sp. KUDC1714]
MKIEKNVKYGTFHNEIRNSNEESIVLVKGLILRDTLLFSVVKTTAILFLD